MGNAANRRLDIRVGTVPDVEGALRDLFQPMYFDRVKKNVSGFQVFETMDRIDFRGVVQPLTDRKLLLKPEGQRAWSWFMLHSDPSLKLDVDDVVYFLGVQTRIMSLKDYRLYGYVEYHLVQGWTGTAGPSLQFDGGDIHGGGPDRLDGGPASDVDDGPDIDGGDAFAS